VCTLLPTLVLFVLSVLLVLLALALDLLLQAHRTLIKQFVRELATHVS
jgi:hypothetical protein